VAFKSGSFRKKCLKKRSKKLLSFYATVSLLQSSSWAEAPSFMDLMGLVWYM
jgi:hypothetical protein